MRLGVERVVLQRDDLLFRVEEEQVLECLALQCVAESSQVSTQYKRMEKAKDETHDPERLHAVLVLDGDLVDVAHARVAAFGQAAVLLERLKDSPSLFIVYKRGSELVALLATANSASSLARAPAAVPSNAHSPKCGRSGRP